MTKTKTADRMLTLLAHFTRGTGTSATLAGGQEIKARDRDEAVRIGERKASAKGLTLSDVTGPDEEDA